MAEETLSPRDLNRALLARQMLLARESVGALAATRRLFALQAQLPRSPFVQLWSRLAGFAADDLLALIRDRKVVRATLQRGTLHLADADDALAFRMTFALPEGTTLPGGVKPAPDVLARALEVAAQHFTAGPRDFDSVREAFEAEGIPDVRVMAFAARQMLPLVQAHSETAYGYEPGGAFTMAKTWLGRDAHEGAQPVALLRRYLAAYGPATPADFAAWSGLKGAAAHFEALKGELVTFRDERKRVLYDVKEGPRPGAEAAAPVRLLPDFDAVMMGHADRARVVPAEHVAKIASKNLQVPPVVLVDGFVGGGWKLERKRKTATVTVTAFEKWSAKTRKAVEAEAVALAAWLEPGSAAEVVFAEG